MPSGPAPRPVADRLWAKVRFGDWLDCWLWTAALGADGYGRIGVGSALDGSRAVALVHRLAYEDLVGPIPDGLHIDHLCRVRACVNPLHLEPVTLAENNRRAQAAAIPPAHCPNGHEYAAENTGRRGTARFCRTCKRVAGLASYHRTKAAR